MMTVEGRPPGPTVGVCVHGRPEHVECVDCATDQTGPPAARADDEPCPHHGTPAGVECLPCRRAADVGRPIGGGPRPATSSQLYPARVDSHCPICKRRIRAYIDQYGHHPLHDKAICATCVAAAAGGA